MAGGCSSKDSYYLGDDKYYSGAPVIQNGIFKRKLGIDAPFSEQKMNFWSDSAGTLATTIVKSLAEEGVNALTGNRIYDKLLAQKHFIQGYQVNGVYQKINGYKTPSLLDKGLAKSIKGVGFATILMTGYSIFEDTQTYSGWELGKAITLDVGGTLTTVGIAIIATALGGPAIVVVGVGIISGLAVNAVIDYVKEEFLIEDKKK
ncbi:hypothetical protein [Paenibacillus endoradicis]|uniref:hypothetical protein n=1 Tax=Paenibacillus endoradicis TaxID=2972487 RepID=UPI0021598B0C|nr:hypothetical protein [Paenibacillus endoradicis]MCR8659104.1 hypothetical protein [Paenibacillus endoradicis]